MSAQNANAINRREFLKRSTLTIAGAIAGTGLVNGFSPVSAYASETRAQELIQAEAYVLDRISGMSVQDIAAIALIQEDGYWGLYTTAALNKFFGTGNTALVQHQYAPNQAGNTALTDGWEWDYTLAGDQMILTLQSRLGVTADGLIGSGTISALQSRMGTYADGYLTGPSPCVLKMQQRLNDGWLF